MNETFGKSHTFVAHCREQEGECQGMSTALATGNATALSQLGFSIRFHYSGRGRMISH